MEWCRRHPESVERPASPFYVALFLNDFVLEEAKKGHIETVYLGIRWGHRTAGLESPTDHPFVKTALEGAKRITARNTTKNRKEPLNTDILKKLYRKFGMSGNVIHLRFLVMCFVGFAGFLRISELKQVQIKHITFKSDHMTISLEESKTDKLREGEVVFISKLGNEFCPVAITKRYITATKLDKDPDNFLISRLAKTRKGHRALGKSVLSDTTIRENFRDMMEVVIDKGEREKFCMHSLRSGGASAAADNGVSDRLIGKHGRWSSNTSRDTYIKDSKKSRLSVSKNLGL